MPLFLLMPKRGLEPPHPCEYMTLNHARVPIPPLRQKARKNIEAFAVLCNAKSRLTGKFPGVQIPPALRLARTDTMRPDKLLASFDLGLDRVVDGDEGLDVREGAGTNEDLPATGLCL